ncbi:MAG: glycosyltransferase family 4 protein [Bacteroidetes bacterium]|nr:glycosyltransferase family 4 protein [Bacteroidota bacterium]
MKKIATVVPYPFLPALSGGQKLISLFNSHLGQQSELHVIGTPNNEIPPNAAYRFYPLLKEKRWRYIDPTLPARIIRLIKEKQIEIIILEHPYLGWLIPFLRIFTKVIVMCHTHNVESERFRSIGKSWWKLLSIYEGYVLRKCDLVFCITEEDKEYMVEKMKVSAEKCLFVPYGIEAKQAPQNKHIAKQAICDQYHLDVGLPLLFFNGVLDYKPNLDALEIILHTIQPKLKSKQYRCNILIAGNKLPVSFNQLKAFNKELIFYVGFVDDIDFYTKAADILLNPVISGGGVKTKMIEAIGLNTTVISVKSGAKGVSQEWSGEKLIIVPDNDWDQFTDAIISAEAVRNTLTPEKFYAVFSWDQIIGRVIKEF